MRSSPRRSWSVLAGTSALALTVAGFAVATPTSATPTSASPTDKPATLTGADCLQAVGSGPADTARQRSFAGASRSYGVPVSVLLGVSFMQSRWDDHGSSPSTSGGFGPMHLTDADVPDASLSRGERALSTSDGPASLHTAEKAADLTGLGLQRLKNDDAANICGGAALLASYQKGLDKRVGATTSARGWYSAVARYGDLGGPTEASTFATGVFRVLENGRARTTNDGQRLTLKAQPGVAPDVRGKSGNQARDPRVDCPRRLDCEWIEAPYEQYGPTPADYGNHDLANREQDLDIDYIVVHDTEGDYPRAIELVTDPTYVSWQFTMNSANGHIAQHLDMKDIGWHAGNWYINMHSIGIEHTGFAATGATWYTEAMYRASAKLVRHLADKYTVKLDRAHVIGHDQVPGILPANVRGMHWDPGPYWDWEHYMKLLKAPIEADGPNRKFTKVMTVAPGFDDNQQLVTDCKGANTGPCATQGTNFVYLRTQPNASAPLVKDAGLRPDGSNSTTEVSDHGARLAAGQKVVTVGRVKTRTGTWVGVWYLGEIGWVFSPKSDPTLVSSRGMTVSAKPETAEVPVYGRAYPEEAAYAGTAVPYQTVGPLQYTIKAGQEYVVADTTIDADYYYAKTFDDSLPDDHTVITGRDKYYEVWFGHRMFFVRAADVVLNR